MSKGKQMKQMLTLLRSANTHDEWNFYLTLMFNTFTISQVELIEDEITFIEKLRGFKTTDEPFKNMRY